MQRRRHLHYPIRSDTPPKFRALAVILSKWFLHSTQLFLPFFRRDGDDLFMFYTFKSPMDSSENLCPIYRLSDYHFDLIDELPCTNAIRIEPFVISSDVYIAVANYKDKLGENPIFTVPKQFTLILLTTGNLETFSEIYKLNLTTDKFYLLQKLKTHAVVDVKYFHLMISGQREHFFVLANSLERDSQGNLSQDANSIIYKLSNGYFVPFQSILLYTVKQFLPVLVYLILRITTLKKI